MCLQLDIAGLEYIYIYACISIRYCDLTTKHGHVLHDLTNGCIMA